MHYGTIKPVDIANGPGVRVSLFVSGCRNHCKGCFNKETWDFEYGEPFTDETKEKIFKLAGKPFIDGLSVLGGDPFEVENQEVLTPFLKEFREKFPGKTVWVYTGYLYEDLKDTEMMQYIDVLVDGPFVEDLKDITLVFRGSSNQRIINVKESMRYECIICRRYNK